jgi:hypothetical protein
VDHTRPKRDKDGKTQPFARLLDVQVGRSGTVAEEWLALKGWAFTSKIRIAAIDPYRGYANAISATLRGGGHGGRHLPRTRCWPVRPSMRCVRGVEQDTLGRRGHGPRTLCIGLEDSILTGANHLTEKMATKLDALL